jgi:glycosyltransferase involved in cell wall biosynthesis
LRILIISDSSPYPLISGDRIKAYNLLSRIAEHHEVWLAVLLENPTDEAGLSHLGSFCTGIEFSQIKRHHPLFHIPGLIKFGLSGKPLELKFTYSDDLARKIRNLVARIDFDLVAIFHSHNALYLEVLHPFFHGKSILMLENIEFTQYESIYRIERKLLNKIRAFINYRMMRRWEPCYAERFDRCISVSDLDRNILKGENPQVRIDVIPNGVDTKLHRILPMDQVTQSLIFIGKMSYSPCSDAAIYFCHEILPLITKKISNIDLWIVGREPPQDVMNLGSDRIHVTGLVKDVVPYYERSSVCVVPLRAGGGTRLKILEAMALGRPVISTSIGCEGLNVINGENILIADNPEEFAQITLKLLSDPSFYHSIVINARRMVENCYDWDILAKRLMGIFEEVVTCT